MSHGDELRQEVIVIINELNLAIERLADSERELDEVNGGILLLGINSSHPSIQGTTAIGQRAKSVAHEYSLHLFELKTRLTLYLRGIS